MMIGLTGPSGAGKSTVAALFRDAGYRVIDCDGLVHGLDRNPEYIKKITDGFGGEYVTGGAVDRRKLGSLVFSDWEKLALLNRLISPVIYEIVMREIDKANDAEADAVLDAPLLFEYGLEAFCDVTGGVIAEPETAVGRLSMRDGRNEAEIRLRRSSQHENAFFVSRCDIIIENNGDLNSLRAAFSDALSQIRRRES